MKRFTWITLVLALFLIPTVADAQVSLGVKGGYDLGDIEEPYVGADARFAIGDAPIRINPTFNYYFAPEGVTFWSAGANALFDFADADADARPYVGAGAAIFSQSIDTQLGDFSTTDFGVTGVGGAEFNLDGIRPFVQAELGIVFAEGDTGTNIGIGGGVLFDL